jgi:hypothetical protein
MPPSKVSVATAYSSHAGDGVQLAGAAHLKRVGKVAPQRCAGDQASHGDRIAAHVQDAPTAERVAQQPMFRPNVSAKAEGCVNHSYIADRTLADEFY